MVSTQRGAQAPVFDISRQSSTRRPTTAHLLEIWPCCRSFTGTRRPDGGSPSRRSSQIAVRVTFDWGNGSRHGDGIVFHAHARVIITQWSFCSSYTIFSCAVIRDVCSCFYRLFIIQVLIACNSRPNFNREPNKSHLLHQSLRHGLVCRICTAVCLLHAVALWSAALGSKGQGSNAGGLQLPNKWHSVLSTKPVRWEGLRRNNKLCILKVKSILTLNCK